jgi:cytochrome c551
MRRLMLAMVPMVALTIGCGDKEDGDSGASDGSAEGTDGSDGDDGADGADGGGDGGDSSEGASIYASSCSGCHGADGEGVSGPAMGTVVPGLTQGEVAEIAAEGTGSMPAVLAGDTAAADNVAAYVVETWGS